MKFKKAGEFIMDSYHRQPVIPGSFNIGHRKKREEWNRLQVRFLKSHRYFTKTALNLRQTKKEAHLQQVKAKLKR